MKFDDVDMRFDEKSNPFYFYLITKKAKKFLFFLLCLWFATNAYADKWAAADKLVERESRKHGIEYGQRVAYYMIENFAKLEYSQMVNEQIFEAILDRAIMEHEPWLLKISVELIEDAYEENFSAADIHTWQQKMIKPLSQMTMIGMRQMRLHLIQAAMEYQRDNQ